MEENSQRKVVTNRAWVFAALSGLDLRSHLVSLKQPFYPSRRAAGYLWMVRNVTADVAASPVETKYCSPAL